MSILTDLDAMSFGPLYRGLEWYKLEVDEFELNIRKSIMDPSVHAYFPYHVTYGQKSLQHTLQQILVPRLGTQIYENSVGHFIILQEVRLATYRI